jgi:hypothetical protein
MASCQKSIGFGFSYMYKKYKSSLWFMVRNADLSLEVKGI